ncbi:hypothetical protein [Affinirhizobium pseudoryzae]|uniref:hypothetical protein n=1 Tax=Allorhizobium pseudoryzae TaxID=379684 RepID=UPI0013EAB353|nr:hypothetical protein [Allorhizobium pseudoryzae]
MTYRLRSEFEAKHGRLAAPFASLVAGEMQIVDLIATYQLIPSDMMSLRSMVDGGIEFWSRGRDRLRDRVGLKKPSARLLDDRRKARLTRAMEHFFHRDDCFSFTVARFDLSVMECRLFVWMVRDTLARYEAARLALRNAMLIGNKRSLPNTYRLDPAKIDDAAERRRLARNDNYIRHLLGKRGMRGGTICYKYRLPLSDALQIRDSANEWRRGCEKAE